MRCAGRAWESRNWRGSRCRRVWTGTKSRTCCGNCGRTHSRRGRIAQKQYLGDVLEGAERIVDRWTIRQRRLKAIEGFSCKLTKLQARHTRLQPAEAAAGAVLELAQYSLITELYAAQREFLIEILRRFDRHLSRAQAAGGRAGFFRPGRVRGAAAGRGARGDTRARPRAVRPHPDGRVSGHQRTAGQAAATWCARRTASTPWATSTNRSSASATPSREGFADAIAMRSRGRARGWWS